MGFAIITDTSANVPSQWLEEHDVHVISFLYTMDGKEGESGDTRGFDGVAYYNALRSGARVNTSQISPQRYTDAFAPLLEGGQDVVYISMSSGISGSCASAQMAAQQLRERYPEHQVFVVDTMGASLGEGLHVLYAEEMRQAGMSAAEAAQALELHCKRMYQLFTVDDLMHLRRTGRISDAKAILGTVLGVKPLLKGNEEGRIVSCGMVRGRKAAIRALAERYEKYCVHPEEQIVGISHAACPEDAQCLAALLQKSARPPREILTVVHEPMTGAHVGPGMLALYFEGDEDVRMK